MTGGTKEDCPYAPISEDRIECSNVVKSQKRTWTHCNIPKWVAIIEFCVLIVLLSVWFAIHKKSTECVQTDKAANSGITSLALHMEAEKEIDFRISPNTSNCSSTPSCFRCKTEIIPHLEPMHCPNDTRVKNSSCLQCDGKCLELPELLIEMQKNGKISQCRQDVTCCTLLIMGILNNYCEGESYNCYTKDIHKSYKRPGGVPVCVCPASNIAGNCTKPFSHQAECKCFKSSGIKLVDQDQMDECGNVSKDWKMCHTYMQGYNCLCERRTGNIDDIKPCQS